MASHHGFLHFHTKENGNSRLCVGMHMANRAILCRRDPAPTAEDLLHTLNGARVFSKLDLRAGYHQLFLDEEGSNIITFQTN